MVGLGFLETVGFSYSYSKSPHILEVYLIIDLNNKDPCKVWSFIILSWTALVSFLHKYLFSYSERRKHYICPWRHTRNTRGEYISLSISIDCRSSVEQNMTNDGVRDTTLIMRFHQTDFTSLYIHSIHSSLVIKVSPLLAKE